jgi:hypothetical protein
MKRKQLKAESLVEHEFYKYFLVSNRLDFFYKKVQFDKKGNIKQFGPLTAHEEYMDDVFSRLQSLTKTLEQMEYICLFFRHFPNTIAYKRAKITKARYFQYHLENYIFRASSLLDKIALLVNDTLRLGIPAKDARFDLVMNMKEARKMGISKYMQILKKGFKNIKTTKNLITHQREYRDEELTRLHSISLIAEAESQLGERSKEILDARNALRIFSAFYRKDKLQQMKKGNHELCLMIKHCLDILYPIFESNARKLSSRPAEPRAPSTIHLSGAQST